MDIQRLLQNPVVLPSMPKAVAQLLAELNKDEPDLMRASMHLAQDPVLTARVLEIANSARYHLARRISDIPEALTVLGVGEVQELAYAAAATSAFRHVPGLDMQQFWRYSLNTAKLTLRLHGTRRTGVSPFTAGLLHAIGELILHRALPDKVAVINELSHPLHPNRHVIEETQFGFSYAKVGGGFARAWNLPQQLVDIIENQTAPFDGGGYEPMTGLLHLAAWRCRAQEVGYDAGQMIDTFPGEIATTLRVDMNAVLERDPIEWTTAQEVQAFTA